jgi:hypothetical protein
MPNLLMGGKSASEFRRASEFPCAQKINRLPDGG